jgi:phage baseplate assembly protein W
MLRVNDQARGLRFPFAVKASGIGPGDSRDDEIRGKIIQVLFTARGERVNQPEFGCGLLNLVFDPNNEILATATEFTIGQAITRWLRDEIVVDAVDLQSHEETLTVEVSYRKRSDLERSAVRIEFR